MRTIYKTASLGISELTEKGKMAPERWKVGGVVKCMRGDVDFELGKLYKIANISKDYIMLQTSPKKYRWTSVNNFKLIGDNHGTHSR